ncbi:MAG: protein kinase [Candidatus Acidiferrales bacterium]
MSATGQPPTAGEHIGGYEILGKIGAGGMGVVYKARDLKLDRIVALKFLPHHLTFSGDDKARFTREAKAASALDHTNIGVIHGLEETPDGQIYIVMAFYEGETLADRIRRGPLPPREAISIAAQVARGLADAHARNIVHRDIKPSNIILTNRNVAKIVDFGLARVLSSTSGTNSANTSGTAAYMSPEQVLGKPVDQHSDIWSLGVVLAEMLTGHHPFRRDDLAGMMFAVLNLPPAEMDGVRVEEQQIVYHALAKATWERYQTCAEMAVDLEAELAQLTAPADPGSISDTAPTQSIRAKDFRKIVEHASAASWGAAPARKSKWWLVVSAAVILLVAGIFAVSSWRQQLGSMIASGGEKHIAVLPFDNIGNDPANEAIAEGFVDSLTGQLSNLDNGQQSLWVVPASVVRSRKVTDPMAAMQDLGATLVVKGSIRREGREVHLTIDVIDAKRLRQIGSAVLDDPNGDMAALQDESVSRIAKMLKIPVTPDMLGASGVGSAPAAYESYLKALGYLQRYDKPGNVDLAIGTLKEAVSTDPRFALGYAELGEAYRLKFQLDQDPKWLSDASANCDKSLQLDKRLSAAYVTLGFIHVESGKQDLAVQEFQRALEINPRDASALNGMAHAYEDSARLTDAEATFRKSAALRPDYWDGYDELGNFYNRHKRNADAIAQFRRAIELSPDNAQVYSNMAAAYLDGGKPEDMSAAEGALRKSIELSPSYAAYANLGYLYMQEKRYPESVAMTQKALQLNDKDFLVWGNLAAAYEWLNDSGNAEAADRKEVALLEETEKVRPESAKIQSELGVLYAKLKQREKAVTRIQAALALSPNDPDVLENVGEAYEVLGDRRQALHYVELSLQKGYALDDLRNDPQLQNLLADPNFKSTGK